ncbi:FKBP-type peptidyl-prolyl cis-trans isomerase [Nitrospira sp. Kam-Ns4a]
MTSFQVTERLTAAFVLSVSLGAAGAQAEPLKGDKMTVSSGKEISIEYTLRLEDKSVLDTNVGKEPLTYTQGAHQIIPGLEKALEGMKKGESKHVTVAPKDGYGEHDPKAFQEVSKEMIPPDALKVGTKLTGRRPDGRTVVVEVKEVKDKTVVLDFNHPLAGKTLYFDVKILDIKDGQPKDAPAPGPKK